MSISLAKKINLILYALIFQLMCKHSESWHLFMPFFLETNLIISFCHGKLEINYLFFIGNMAWTHNLEIAIGSTFHCCTSWNTFSYNTKILIVIIWNVFAYRVQLTWNWKQKLLPYQPKPYDWLRVITATSCLVPANGWELVSNKNIPTHIISWLDFKQTSLHYLFSEVSNSHNQMKINTHNRLV